VATSQILCTVKESTFTRKRKISNNYSTPTHKRKANLHTLASRLTTMNKNHTKIDIQSSQGIPRQLWNPKVNYTQIVAVLIFSRPTPGLTSYPTVLRFPKCLKSFRPNICVHWVLQESWMCSWSLVSTILNYHLLITGPTNSKTEGEPSV
jgi:hypothetical protein